MEEILIPENIIGKVVKQVLFSNNADGEDGAENDGAIVFTDNTYVIMYLTQYDGLVINTKKYEGDGIAESLGIISMKEYNDRYNQKLSDQKEEKKQRIFKAKEKILEDRKALYQQLKEEFEDNTGV